MKLSMLLSYTGVLTKQWPCKMWKSTSGRHSRSTIFPYMLPTTTGVSNSAYLTRHIEPGLQRTKGACALNLHTIVARVKGVFPLPTCLVDWVAHCWASSRAYHHALRSQELRLWKKIERRSAERPGFRESGRGRGCGSSAHRKQESASSSIPKLCGGGSSWELHVRVPSGGQTNPRAPFCKRWQPPASA
jgi:hypothetical protein